MTKYLCPEVQLKKRQTVQQDCMNIFEKEKQKIKDLFSRICGRVNLTTDTWTSNQTIGYRSISAHFTDELQFA